MHADYISANSTPTLQSYHPPELNSLRYRHLQHPIVLVIFAVANHNTAHANEKAEFNRGRLVPRCRNGAVPPNTPSRSGGSQRTPFSFPVAEGGRTHRCNSQPGSHLTYWQWWRHPALITAEQFRVDCSIISRAPQQNTFNGILNLLCCQTEH